MTRAGSQAPILRRLRKLALALPEVVEVRTFDHPTWRAGKKSFLSLETRRGRPLISFKADPDEHPILMEDERFSAAAYVGQHGWVNLDGTFPIDWDELEELIVASYRQSALKRMLRALDER